jgi:PilZ domain
LIERRRFTRYPLHLQMRIIVVNHDAVSIPACTCNVSRAGVLFRCSADLVVGQEVDYVIDLYPERHLQLCCKGTVARWETLRCSNGSPESEPAKAIAITLDAYECVFDEPEYVASPAAQSVGASS